MSKFLKIHELDNVAIELDDFSNIKKGHKVACKDIKKGEYVHVHNMDALRGRGDL